MFFMNKISKKNYNEQKYYITLIVFVVFLCILTFISFFIGRYDKPLFSIEDVKVIKLIVLRIRLPRIALALLVGAALSASGCIYQSLLQNPMASPDILGCTNGAATGAALAILLNFPKIGVTINAFIFSFITILLVYFIGNRAIGNRVVNLILSGIIVSSIFSSITSYIKLVADPTNKLPAITYWLMGSLSGFTSKELPFVVVPILTSLILVYLFRWKLNILSLGDSEARTLGIDVLKYRLVFILLATILTATSVAFSGSIGYVGLVIPHLSRKLIGNNNRYLIPISMVIGANFMLLVDNISRTLLHTEIPIGILTSLIGAPFFLYLIYRKEGNRCSM